MTTPRSILFVCLGNICRSPSAEAVMRTKLTQLVPDIHLDSAGTAGYHIGNPPDPRAIVIGQSLGFELDKLRARQVSWEDFYEFELIFAMDETNLSDLQTLQKTAIMHADGRAVAQLDLFDPTGQSVADPYYGDEQDFKQMYAHLQRIADQHIAKWQLD
ncbi:low molecular weight protein-tyrosine-phosphatase [Moraxella canis]|uniref:protein-tyrosine-phosphatase n=1 Tax=Moraxella canis TaxID=90239 RepID=A0A1S9ZK94_9GAMM|nr:low molecular weight protein-tyrosine-phosphatase [Moraxella canis]OOR83461.1 phosphotyrosine protein phosphatase [Moraxella canis]